MTRSGSSTAETKRAGLPARLALVLCLGPAALLGGCASTVADLPYVGMPAGAPARPAQAGDYLPVNDVPNPSTATNGMLSTADQAKLQADLIKARDRQAIVTDPAKTATK